MTTLKKRDVTTNKTPRKEVYKQIDKERDYQDKLLSDFWATHTLGEFILMLDQYVHKAQKKWNYHERDEEGYMLCIHDIRKIAAIAVRCMEQHGAPKRKIEKVSFTPL